MLPEDSYYKPKNSNKGNLNVDDNFIRNMTDIRTRKLKNIYYKNDDGNFHTGWKEELGRWYYFDKKNLALVTNVLFQAKWSDGLQ